MVTYKQLGIDLIEFGSALKNTELPIFSSKFNFLLKPLKIPVKTRLTSELLYSYLSEYPTRLGYAIGFIFLDQRDLINKTWNSRSYLIGHEGINYNGGDGERYLIILMLWGLLKRPDVPDIARIRLEMILTIFNYKNYKDVYKF